ncbi:hypothetical protein Pint_15563 [Pistacia integerrima]|uniref:Uncharacterized protein n=1 Tax=Pistacia integerrima TaxID=434235 RepID=A0ACC0ZAL9_9ROSI|nr:hypothetical protein Pint_15563 [Pistacia integerrima]
MALGYLFDQWRKNLYTTLFFPILYSLLFLIISLLYYFVKLNRSLKQLNLPPSPPKLPIIGNLHQLGTLPHRSLQNLSQKHGSLMLLHFGSAPTLIVSSAETARELLKTHDAILIGRPRTRAARVLFNGCSDIAFSPYGDYWREVKRICVLKLLSKRRVLEFHSEMEEEVADMVGKIRVSCLNGASINFREMLVTVSSNIISRSVLGQIYLGEESNKSFGELSRKAMDLIGAFCFEDMIPALGWMDVLTGLVANLKRTSKELDNFLDQVIEERQVLSIEDHEDHYKKALDDDMLDFNLTRQNIKAILLDMFTGGTDTISATIEWAMAELIKNHSLMKKAQGEVRRVIKDKARIDFMDIAQMEFIKFIIKETLRLHAPALIFRETSASIKMNGYDIPPKTRVLINTWAIQRDPKLWDRAEEFLPERFENDQVDYFGDQDFQFIAFGSGRRSCPGTSFATAEAEYVLANLLNWFDWELPGGQNGENLDMSDIFSSVLRKKLPVSLVGTLHH